MEGMWRALFLLAGLVQLSLGVTRVSLDPHNVIVSVNTTRWVHLTNDKFLSLSVPPSFFLTHNYSTAIKNMLQGLSPTYLRVGGAESDKLYFRSVANISQGAIFTMRQWEALQQLAVDSGASLVFSVNPHPQGPGSDNWDSSDILHLLHFSDMRRLSPTTTWQLGYVTDMSKSDGSTVGRDVARLRKALDLIPRYRSSAVLGPDFPACVSPDCLRFLRDFLLQSGDIISPLVVQLKPDSDQREEEIVFEKISRLIHDVDKKISTKNVLESGYFKNIPKKQLWIAETGAEGYTGVFTDALAWALRVGHAARLGYDVVLRRLAQLSEPSPDYWVSLLYRRLVGRAVLDANPATHPSVMMFAHCTSPSTPSFRPGAITVWGVNAAERVAVLELPHPHTLLYALTAGPHQGSTHLNGEELCLRGASLPELSPRELSAGPVSVPAYSVFYIVLPDLKAPACLSFMRPDSSASDTTNLPQHDTFSDDLMSSKNANSLPTESTFPVNLLTDQSSDTVQKGDLFESRAGDIRNVGAAQGGLNLKLNERQQATTEKQSNTKGNHLEKATQSLLNCDADCIKELAKKKALSFIDATPKESGTKNKNSKVFHNIRFKRSELGNDHVQIGDFDKVEMPHLHTRFSPKQSTRPYDILKKLQATKIMDKESLEKSQQNPFLSKEDLAAQVLNNKRDSSIINYFPGEFYNILHDLVYKRNEQLSDIEDPNEAIAYITKDLPKSSVQESTLKVTIRPSNNQIIDRQIFERTTEKMEHYYNHAVNFIKETSCGNGKHNGKMTCCMENENPFEKPSSQVQLKEVIRLNKRLRDNSFRAYESPKLTATSNDQSHVETLFKNRIKREIIKLDYDQSKETPRLNSAEEKSVKYPLDEEKLALLLKELTDEGEQLLKSFDQDYERNLLEYKLTPKTSLDVTRNVFHVKNSNSSSFEDEQNIDFSNGNSTGSYLGNNLFVDRVIKPKKKYPLNIVMNSVSPQTGKPVTSSTEKGGILKEINRLDIISNSPIVPELLQKENDNEYLFPNNNKKHKSDIKDRNSSQTKEENNFDKHKDDMLVESKELSTLDRNYSVNVPLDPLRSSITTSRSAEQIQLADESFSKFGEHSTISYPSPTIAESGNDKYYHRTDQLDQLNNSVFISKTYQTITSSSTPSTVQKVDSRDVLIAQVSNPNNNSLPQLKLSSQSNTRTLPVYILQQIQHRPVPADGGNLQPSPLSLIVSNLHKQRLESIRARLEKARQRMLNSAQPKIASKQEFKRDTSQNWGVFGIGSGADNLNNAAKSEKESKKTDFETLRENTVKNFQDKMFPKPLTYDSELMHQPINPMSKVIKNIKTLPNVENNLKELEFKLTGSKYTEEKNVSPESPPRNYMNAEHSVVNNRMIPAKPKGILSDRRDQQGSNAVHNDKLRSPRSIQTPCIRDRFNDFETHEEDNKFQKNTNVQPTSRNEQTEMKALQKSSQINRHMEGKEIEAKNSSNTTKFLPYLDHVSRLKRSIDDEIQMNEVEMRDLSNEIVKEHPLNDVSGPDERTFDTMLHKTLSKTVPNKTGIHNIFELAKQYRKTNQTSLEIFSNNVKEMEINTIHADYDTNENDNKSMEPQLHEVNLMNENSDVSTTTTNTGRTKVAGFDFQETNTKTDNISMLQKTVVSNVINKVQNFFKAITAVIKNLSQTNI